MKWMIASDIHGSAYYCRLLTEAFAREQADRMLLLGDLLYHGPRNDLPQAYDTKETARLLNTCADRLIAIRGNCDAEVDQLMLDFPILAEYALLELDGRLLMAAHGHNFNAQNLPGICRGGILLNGHTHIPACKEHDGVICLNPGSVSLPKEASPHSYMTLEGGVFTWKDIEGRAYMRYPDLTE